jgi:hypothetical protein
MKGRKQTWKNGWKGRMEGRKVLEGQNRRKEMNGRMKGRAEWKEGKEWKDRIKGRK